MEKLNQARAFMRFNDAGSLEGTLDALLDFFLQHKDPAKRAQRRVDKDASKPALKRPIKRAPRYVATKVKEKIFAEGQGRCAYVSPHGKQCTETRHLEYDHVFPIAAGGRSESENLRLLCPAHNKLAAMKFFGKLHISRKIEAT